jgi:hypothetical protein
LRQTDLGSKDKIRRQHHAARNFQKKKAAKSKLKKLISKRNLNLLSILNNRERQGCRGRSTKGKLNFHGSPEPVPDNIGQKEHKLLRE